MNHVKEQSKGRNNMNIWGDKPYYSLDYYLKNRFGEKVYKLSLDASMTCPNRDGTLGTRGCIFCSEGGSGDFAANSSFSITKQIEEAKTKVKNKSGCTRFIAYFQSYTNTYAPIEYLKKAFFEAVKHPDIVALSIATRPDCLDEPVLELLSELNRIKPVWVELGLQTIHERTAAFIRRGYPLTSFEKAVKDLAYMNIDIIVHIIIGLPYQKNNKLTIESPKEILETIEYLSKCPIQGIKLQLLHVLKDTDLAGYLDDLEILSFEDYINMIILCIEHLPEHMVIHRITGDGPKSLLLAPLWSSNKKKVLNTIHKELRLRNTWQGRLFCVTDCNHTTKEMS